MQRRVYVEVDGHAAVRSESMVAVTTVLCFFFQAEDGIRDLTVTGVQTCALPISCALPWLKFRRTTLTPSRTICSSSCGSLEAGPRVATILVARRTCMECLSLRVCNRVSILTRMRLHEGNIPACGQIGRASCRERV